MGGPQTLLHTMGFKNVYINVLFLTVLTQDVNTRKSVDTCVNTIKRLNTLIAKFQTCAFI